MSKEPIYFTPEEISVIDKNLGFIVFDWAKSLINHILTIARENGVEVVYMNTTHTLAVNAPVSNESKAEYFYNKLPPMLGFKKEKANLRGIGKEELWAYRFADVTAFTNSLNSLIKTSQQQFTLEQLPSKYQGAFIGIIGRKPFYTQYDVKMVLDTLKNKEGKGKLSSKFYYDWESTKHSGGQRFNPKLTETVVLQKISEDAFNRYSSDPIMAKFFSFLFSQQKHFGVDEMGFALLSKISPKIWVINEIQTDCINKYMDIRNKLNPKRDDKASKTKGVSWDTLKDMLVGRNRSKWVAKLEGNEALKNQIMQDPNIIEQLPDDSQDIDKWIQEQRGQNAEVLDRANRIRQYLAGVNFNSGIFRTY